MREQGIAGAVAGAAEQFSFARDGAGEAQANAAASAILRIRRNQYDRREDNR
jgi:hypothetical protein